MTRNMIMRLMLQCLNTIPRKGGIPGIEGAPEPFCGNFDTYQLAAAVSAHLNETKGFTVILGYPDSSETYSSSSSAETWEEAVIEVAGDMYADNDWEGEDVGDLTITDVLEGAEEHSSYPGTDRHAIVRFDRDGKARILDQHAAYLEDLDTVDKYHERNKGEEG